MPFIVPYYIIYGDTQVYGLFTMYAHAQNCSKDAHDSKETVYMQRSLVLCFITPDFYAQVVGLCQLLELYARII